MDVDHSSHRLLTLFPRLRQVALHKDVGRLPLHLARDQGWQATLAFCQPHGPPIADSDFAASVRLAPLGVTDSRLGKFVRLGWTVLREARSVTVLNLYQLGIESSLYAVMYKALNPDGVAFLKLDMDLPSAEMLLSRRRSLRARLNEWLISRAPIDFFTVETKVMEDKLRPFFATRRLDLRFLPCGFSDGPPLDPVAVGQGKERIVLTVGRLGMPQKNSELLLGAIQELPPESLRGWRFFFVGSFEGVFREEVARVLRQRPDLVEHVVLRDHISDRAELFDLYRRARIFCLTSRWESFGLVLLEALHFGCFVLTTPVGAAEDLIEDGVGRLIEPSTVGALVHLLTEELRCTRDAVDTAMKANRRLKRGYEWGQISATLARYVDDVRQRRVDRRR